MERKPQNLKNHVKLDPPFHLFIGPVFFISWIISAVMLVRHPGFLAAWAVVFMTAAVVAIFRIRQYALKVQDRVIRMEERLRLASLLPEELVGQANDSTYGLAAGIWTRDIKKAHRLASRLRAGTVWINCYNIFDAALPFGGYKQSGWGREMGHEVLEQYTEVKAVCAAL